MEDVVILPPTPAEVTIITSAPEPAALIVMPVTEVLPPSQHQSYRLHYTVLIVLTLLGGVLRFVSLERPAIWGDEAQTYGRVCGSFEGLLTRLQDAGFGPLHYELYWWIGQHTKLTPFVLRMVPAAAGTLMIPAMYWLAVQLAGRRVALLTALLTTTSAYLLNYSRDAKMYSHLWLFAVLNVASLLWWLRVRTRLSWCVWLTTGTIMVGLQAVGWIVIAIEALMVLTCKRGHWSSMLRLLPIAAAAVVIGLFTIAPPVALQQLRSAADFDRGSIVLLVIVVIVGCLNLARVIARLVVRYKASIYSKPRAQSFINWSTERALVHPWLTRFTHNFRWPPLVLFLFGLGIIASGPYGYYHDFNQYLDRLEISHWGVGGISWVQGYNYGRTGPMLVGYTASAYLTGWEWSRPSDEQFIPLRTVRLLKAGTLAVAAAMALGLLPWWKPRRDRGAMLGSHSPPPLPHRGWRTALWIVLWITLPAYGFYCVSFPLKQHAGPSDWLHDTADTWKTAPHWAQAAIVILGGLWVFVAGRTWQTRVLRLITAMMLVVIPLGIMQIIYRQYPGLDIWLADRSRGWAEHQSVWMPRYLGIILPPVFIVAAVLMLRVPTRPLRWLGISAFVIVNLSVHWARVYAGSEPPSPLIAQDLLDSQPQPGTPISMAQTRTYCTASMSQASGQEPGTVALESPSMTYYESILKQGNEPASVWPPHGFGWSRRTMVLWPSPNSWLSFSAFIVNDVRRTPTLKRIVTWERFDPITIDLTDKPLDALAPQWRLQGEEEFMVRDHWRWTDTGKLRRRVYVRVAEPTAMPDK